MGFFQGAADFDPSPTNAILGATGTLDIFMAKYGPNGNYLWAKKFGAAFSNSGHSIALNASGNVLITGNFYSVVDFDPSAAVYNLSSSVFNAYLKSNVFVGQYNQVTAAFSSAFAPGDYQFNEERSYSVKNDQLGNVFICGEFSGAIDFDFSPVTDYYMASAGGTDGFVAKYSPAGALIWARRIGGPKTDVCYGLAIDNLGNCLITGTFDSTATFNAALTATLASNGSQDVFLMKLNPVGFLLWHTGFGGTGNDRGKTIAVNSANDVYVAGYFEGTVDTDPSAGSNILFSNGATDIFFSGFAPNGNFVWGKGIGSATDDEPRSIAIDNAGELVMTGGFSQTTDFDPGPGFGFLNCSGAYDIFLAKYNSSGAYIFANKIGAAGGDHAMSLCVDAANNYIISGDFSGTVDFDPATFSTVNLIASGPYDGFVAKYNSLGTYQWVRHISGINGQTADGVNTDLNSNIYITGKYGATTNFGSIILSNTGPLDQYISKYDASGNNLWVSRAGGNNFNVGGSLVIDNSNNIYSTGYFYGVSDFDPSFLTANLASAGAGDVFLLKYKQCITTSVSVSSQSNVSCYGGNNGFVNLIASGGTGITYSWTPTGNTTASLTSLSIGSYSCLVMNSCGAASSINITVTQPSSLNINMGMSPTLICQGVNTILQANVTGGTPAYTYTWSTGANTAPISFPATVSGGYTCTITDAKGCIKTATTAIVVNTSPTVNIVASTNTLCANTTATLNASGANSYTWNPNVVSSSVVVSPSVTSTYTVTGKSLNGCADTETVSLIVSPGPPLNVVSTSSILCLGNTATITATGSSTYTWSNGNNTNAIVITPTANITYTVTGISSAGCVDSISYTQNVSICTGLDGSLSKNNSIISVYPNPNTGEFYIGEFENNIGKEVEVFNSIGQLVQQFKIETNIPKVNINEHPNGFYFVVIKDKDASIHNSKIVKTN
ncbi:MAG: T9SS type A sorting domain-containing protein [Bacteroidota bacterium]|nr:T9SS type A sorting domain-containing protein [Bacteroidota bacterium]